jgi:hypothetical protein
VGYVILLSYSRGRVKVNCSCGKQTRMMTPEDWARKRHSWEVRHKDHGTPTGRADTVETDMQRLAHRILRSTSADKKGGR